MGDRNKQPWTLEEEAKLRSLYSAHPRQSISDIAEIMGRSANAVRCRVHVLGISRIEPWHGHRGGSRPNVGNGGYVF